MLNATESGVGSGNMWPGRHVMFNATKSGSNMLRGRQSEVRVTSELWSGLIYMKYIKIHKVRV